MIQTIFQSIIFFTFITYILIKIGVPKSISDAGGYELPGNNFRLPFRFFGIGIGIPMWTYVLCDIKGETEMLFSLAGLFMCGLAIASSFKEFRLVKFLHYTFTGMAILLSIAGIYSESAEWKYLIPTGMAVILLAIFAKKPLFWIEVLIFPVLIYQIFKVL